MKKSSSEQQSRIRKQFDSFCKTLLKNEMIDYERERNYRLKYEISFSELTQKELRQLEIMDDYIVESEMFHVFDYDIEVKDELIGEALKSLPEKKRNVILLSFFSGYDRYRNCKIYESCKKYHSSSSYKFLIALKKIMEEIRTGKRNNTKLLPYHIIVSAASGDVEAINRILKHYEGYIAVLSTRKLYDEYGNLHYCVDETLRRRLETKLITKILKFKIA